MPIYEYLCDCGEIFEVVQSMNDEKIKKCSDVQDCKGNKKVQRLLGKPTLLKLGHLSDKKLREELGDNIDS